MYSAGRRTSSALYAVAARFASLTVSVWGALLGLFVDSSLIARTYDQLPLIDYLNWSVLALSALGFADVVWHDIHGRVIWPSFPAQKRHAICVLVYSTIGSVWLIKAFVAAATQTTAGFMLSAFTLSMAVVCGLTATAIALEAR